MKRKLSLLLAICLLFSMVFTGCSKNQEKASEETGKKNTESTEGNGEDEGIYTENGTFPIVKEKIEFSILTPDSEQIIDYETNGFTIENEEKTNIHVNWEMVPVERQSMQEKINLVLASGNYPDIFWGLDITDSMEALYGVEQDVFIPLDDLIEKYAPNFKKNVLDKYPSARGMITALDGHIYALPSINECYHCAYSQKFWINQFWLDELGLDMPTTTEEFYQVLKAFKEQDPNKNGKQDEIPMSGSDTWHGDVVPFLMNAFILDPGLDSKDKLIVKDGKVMTIVDKEEYREGLKYIKKLYDEGLIQEGSFTQKIDQLKQTVTNPNAELMGGFPGGFSGLVIEAATYPERYRHYISMPPLEGPKGVRQTSQFDYLIQPGEFLISKANKYPEAAMRWADQFYSTEGQRNKTGSKLGVSYELAKEGELGLDGKQAKIKLIKAPSIEAQNNGYGKIGIEWMPAENRFGIVTPQDIDPLSAEGLEKLLYQETANKYEPYAPQDAISLPVTKLTSEESGELQVIRVELEKYIEESRLKFLLDEWDLDSDWDQYIEGLKNIGVEKFVDVYQVAYERQYLSK